MRMFWGKRKDWNARMASHGFSPLIQTAFIERVNLTLRRGVSALMRKTWALVHSPERLLLHVEWWRAYYHFVRPHESLAVIVPGLRRVHRRTPAQAAGLASRIWSIQDVLTLPLAGEAG